MLIGGLQKYEKFDFGATRQSKPSRNTELRRVPSRMKHNLSKSLYYGNTAFFSKNERQARQKAVRAAAPYLKEDYKKTKKTIFERREKINLAVTRSYDVYPREWPTICLKAYTTATRLFFFRKMSDKHVKKQFGPRRRTFRRIAKRTKNSIFELSSF